MTKPYFEFWK